MNGKPNKLQHLHRDRGYRFTDDRDPDMEWITREIDKSGLSISELLEAVLDVSDGAAHVSYGTILNWLNGTTKRPQNFTLTVVARALGYDREFRKISVSRVH